ncbi:MAG: phosphoribosyl-ATP diphosphatase [Candidatus Altiarchaeota archaeon]
MENLDVLERLWNIIEDRRKNPTAGSYTAKMMADRERLFEKLQEELQEIIEAARNGKMEGKDSLSWETADFLYHLLVLLSLEGLDPDMVLSELEGRMR